MFVSPETLAYMLSLGLADEKLVELFKRLNDDAQMMQPPAKTAGAVRQQRLRDKRSAESVTRDVTRDVTEVSPTPPSPSEPKGSSGKVYTTREAKKSRRVPESWHPTEADLQVGADEGFSPGEIARELAKIRDYEFQTPRSDWSACFRGWLRKAAERRPNLQAVSRSDERTHPAPSAKYLAKQANYQRAFAGAEAAARRRHDGGLG